MPSFGTKLRKAILTKPAQQAGKICARNPGVGQVVGLAIAAAIPGAGTAVYVTAMAAGSAAEAGAKEEFRKQERKKEEAKLEESRLAEQKRLADLKLAEDRRLNEQKAQVDEAKSQLHAERQQAQEANQQRAGQLNTQEALINQVLDHARQRQIPQLTLALQQLNAESLELLGNRPLNVCHQDDRRAISDLIDQMIEQNVPARAFAP